MRIFLTSDKIITKKDFLLQVQYGNLSELSIKLINLIYANLPKNIDPCEKYSFRITEIIDALGIKTHAYGYIKKAVMNILKTPIVIEEEGYEFHAFNYFSEVDYERGLFTIKVPEFVAKMFKNLDKNYVSYNVLNILSLKGVYMIKLYEILRNKLSLYKRYKRKPEIVFEVDEFKKILNIPDSYTFKDIKKQILARALIEINKKTDMDIKIELEKEGNKYARIYFFLKEKEIKKSKNKKSVSVKRQRISLNIDKNDTTKENENQENIKKNEEDIIQHSKNNSQQSYNKDIPNNDTNNTYNNNDYQNSSKTGNNQSKKKKYTLSEATKKQVNYIKSYFKSKKLNITPQKVMLFEKKLLELNKNYTYSVVSSVIAYAKDHHFYSKFLLNPNSFFNNFEVMLVSMQDEIDKTPAITLGR